MGIDPGGIVPLQAPITSFKAGNIEQAAEQIKAQNPDMPFSKSDIVSFLQDLESGKINLTQKHIDDLAAGNPIIPRPRSLGEIHKSMTELQQKIEGNAWFNANPIAIFFEKFINLSFMLSQIKLTEAEEASESILLMSETASEIAQMIKDIGYQEFVANIVSGALSAAKGALQLGGGLWARKKAAGYGKQSGFALQSYTMQVQGVTEGIGAVDSVVKGITSLNKASLEAMKTITENLLKTYERKLSAALDAYKTSDEMVIQILQNLQKLIDEAYKAHGFQVH